ncbi:MAG: NifU family protein [Microscillaceae bacterium]|nr:NifU family protein [Microscillaceae bacterium]
MNSSQNKYITVYTEANPNPNSLKFVLNYLLVPEGSTYDFPDLASAQEGSPLAEELFKNFNFVKRVFVMSNFITITKDEQSTWHEVAADLKKFIKEYLEAGKPLLLQESNLSIDDNEPEIDRKIKSILDEYVRPAVESDGGAIIFHSFEAGTVKVLLQGACSGCPSSTLTLKQGIENLLTSMVPEVQEVVAEGI